MQPLGEALGGLHADAVHEQLLGELAVGLEPRHQLGDLGAGRDRGDGDDVELAAVLRAVEVGQADAVVPRLARAGEAGQHRLAVLGIEHDDVVALRVAREVAEQRARAAGSPARATCARAAAGSRRAAASFQASPFTPLPPQWSLNSTCVSRWW